ncbi:fimbrial protein [Serratia fonticola]|uniref:fimbrial protein n=1 Tax=Serratia fonticola TaxID=47917 RepID=UPI0034C6481E
MEKNLYVGVLTAITLGFATSALAIDGTVTFEGIVNDTTCTLTTDSQNMAVLLPSVTSADFTGADAAATIPAVKFSLSAAGCDAGAVSASVLFATGGNVDSTNGNLNNSVSGGTDAQIRIYKADGTTPINLANFGESASNIGNISGESVSIDFYANYFSKNAKPTAGVLKTSIQYSMEYL